MKEYLFTRRRGGESLAARTALILPPFGTFDGRINRMRLPRASPLRVSASPREQIFLYRRLTFISSNPDTVSDIVIASVAKQPGISRDALGRFAPLAMTGGDRGYSRRGI
jgi:hypothetical protein